MQFLILAYDGDDEGALERRMNARTSHLEFCGKAVKRGEHIAGAAMLTDDGKMKGSMMLVEYPSRKELDEWLENEIYVKNGVWKKVEVIPCKIAPGFEHMLSGKEEPLKKAGNE